LIVTTQLVWRFYYFMAEDIESLQKLTDIFHGHGLLLDTSNTFESDRQTEGTMYNLDYPQGKLKILAVKPTHGNEHWQTALKELRTWEEEDPLAAMDIVEVLTIIAGTEQREEAAKTVAAAQTGGDIYTLQKGRLSCLKRDRSKHQTIYLFSRDNNETDDLSFLSRRLPLLHGGVLRLQALDFLLHDRLLSIGREKEEIQRGLIKVLHTKLVMNQATLMAAEELENEIQTLAAAYGKLVEDQNMLVDGQKNFDAAMLALQRQINVEAFWQEPAAVFAQLTEPYQQRRDEMNRLRDELNEVQEDYRAAMNVVQSKIEVMNSRTNIATQEQIKGLLEVNTEMQKQGLVYQYAAGLIEFIVLAYYSHTLWSHLQHAAYTVIPSWIQFITVMLFSGNVVWATHLIAEYNQGEHHVRTKLRIALFLFLLLFVFIVVGSILAAGHSTGH